MTAAPASDARREIDAVLARIDAAPATLGAFVHVDVAAARRAAEASRPGPLHALPIAIKDVIDVAGMPTRANSRLFLDAPPAARDSAVAARLRAAGAIIVGKLHCWELSVGGPCDDTPFPPARNPWNPSRDPGGSSSGAAVAVAAGLVPAAIGGDTGGSIRLPAAHCGVVGFKPSFGSVPMAGILPFAGSLDVAGPIAASVDVARRIAAVLQAAPLDGARDWNGRRVGIPRGLLDLTPPSATIADAFAQACRRLEHLGARLVELPFADAALFNACYFVVARSEAFARWRDVLARDGASLSRIARRSLAMGALLDAADLVDATRLRRELARRTAACFAEVDVLALPTTPDVAGDLLPGDGVTRPDTAPYTRPFSLVGAPALSMPCGLSPDGLPIGLQLVGRFGDDATVLALAEALETAPDWPWRAMRPEIAR